MKSQVTTKQGDEGNTRSLAGDTLSKSHIIIECTGCVDEARAHTALLRHLILEAKPDDHEQWGEFLFWLTHVYFLIGTACNDPQNKHPEYRHGEVSDKHMDRLEAVQRDLEARITLPKQFVATASNTLAAQTDVTTTVVRRLERRLVALKEAVPEFDAAHILPFVNRLSDTLYMLARFLDNGNHVVVDYTVLD